LIDKNWLLDESSIRKMSSDVKKKKKKKDPKLLGCTLRRPGETTAKPPAPVLRAQSQARHSSLPLHWIPFVAPLKFLFLDENESVDPKEKATKIACLLYSRASAATFMQKGGLLKH
jgi:hypothetical protein